MKKSMGNILPKYDAVDRGRRKKKQWKLIAFTGCVAILLFLVSLFCKWILVGDWFTVSEISLENKTSIPDSFLLSAVETQMLDNKIRALFGPRHILFWKIGAKPSAVASLPVVEQVEIETNFFERLVSVKAFPRDPFGIVCESMNKCFSFDKMGVLFSEAPYAEGPLILKVVDATGKGLIVGGTILPQKEWIKNFFSVIDELKRSNIGIATVTFTSLPLQEWKVTLLNGPTLFFSFGVTPKDLGDTMSRLALQMDFARTEYIDFRVPDRIYYR